MLVTTPYNHPLFDTKLFHIPNNNYLAKYMSIALSPFEADSIIQSIYIVKYIQVCVCTLLVYDLCEYKVLPITPILTTFITVITYDKEVSMIINVLFILTYPL